MPIRNLPYILPLFTLALLPNAFTKATTNPSSSRSLSSCPSSSPFPPAPAPRTESRRSSPPPLSVLPASTSSAFSHSSHRTSSYTFLILAKSDTSSQMMTSQGQGRESPCRSSLDGQRPVLYAGVWGTGTGCAASSTSCRLASIDSCFVIRGFCIL